MDADVVAMPWVRLDTVARAIGEVPGPQVNECLVQMLKDSLAEAESGRLHSAVLVGEYVNETTIRKHSTCWANLYVIDSLLGLSKRDIQDEIDSACRVTDKEGA